MHCVSNCSEGCWTACKTWGNLSWHFTELFLNVFHRVSQERSKIGERSAHLIFDFSCWRTFTLILDDLYGVVDDM
jgi:hypothetical protein